MSDPLSLVSGAIKTLQKVREITQKIKNAEMLNLTADLNLNLAELKMQIANLQTENGDLRNELKNKQDKIVLQTKLTLKNGLYFFKEIQDERPEGPYCTRCYDVDERLVLVTKMAPPFDTVANYVCPNCEAQF